MRYCGVSPQGVNIHRTDSRELTDSLSRKSIDHHRHEIFLSVSSPGVHTQRTDYRQNTDPVYRMSLDHNPHVFYILSYINHQISDTMVSVHQGCTYREQTIDNSLTLSADGLSTIIDIRYHGVSSPGVHIQRTDYRHLTDSVFRRSVDHYRHGISCCQFTRGAHPQNRL